MKKNKISRNANRRGFKIVAGIAAALALAAAVACAYSTLEEMWLEQCEITDMDSQVEISDGAMVKADVIADEFGLRKGANLAKINFRKERERILAKIPNIKDVRIRRILPGKVSIGVDERVPAVRIKGERGCVADLEGVVFRCQRQTQSLPVVKERAGANIQPGSKMSGMGMAALRLIEACGAPEFKQILPIEADASGSDCITMVIGSYSKVKIAWDDMEKGGEKSRKSMMSRLTDLAYAVQSGLLDEVKVWDATQPGRIYADTRKGSL